MDTTPVARRLIAAGLAPERAHSVTKHQSTAVRCEARISTTASTPRLVASGWVVAQHRLDDGIVQTLRIYMGGDLIDDELGAMPATSLIALTPATIAHVPGEISCTTAFRVFEEADQQAKARRELEHMLRLGRFDAQQKIAHFLLEMDERWRAAYAQEQGAMPFPFKQPDIGDYLALSPVHVNRTLMTLRKGGLIDIARGRLFINDYARLKRASERRFVLADALVGAA